MVNYRSCGLKRVVVRGTKGRIQSIEILTLYDRLVQNLFKIVLQPQLESFGDSSSFGFRKGRSAHMAILLVAKALG